MSLAVMFADDTEDMRVLLRAVLTSGGFEILDEAVDGTDAISMWDRHRHRTVRAVVLDHRMPGLTGLEVAAHIRRDCPHQRIVICSAFEDDELRTSAAAIGVDLVGKSELFSLVDHI